MILDGYPICMKSKKSITPMKGQEQHFKNKDYEPFVSSLWRASLPENQMPKLSPSKAKLRQLAMVEKNSENMKE